MSPKTTAVIEVVARDKASGILRNIANNLKDIGRIAAGIALAKVLEAGIGAGINLAKTGIDIASSYLMAERGLSALLAVQKVWENAQWDEIRVGTRVRKLTEEERKKREKLIDSIKKHEAELETLKWTYKEQQAKVIQMIAKYGEAGIATNKWRTKVAETAVDIELLEKKIAEERAELERLNRLEGKQIAITERVFKPTFTYGEALDLVKGEAAEVWGEVKRLAMMRGIPADAIASTYLYGVAVGMPLDTLKNLVPAMIDWATVTNKSTLEVKHASKALGDIAARGKLAHQEILQLSNVNIPVLTILAAKLGKTREEVRKLVEEGAIPAEMVFSVLAEWFGVFSAGAEDMANTFPIATKSLKELTRLGLYEFFAPVLGVLAEVISKFRDWAIETGFLDRLREKGEQIASWLSDMISKAKDFFSALLGAENPLWGIFTALRAIGVSVDPGILLQLWELFNNLKTTFGEIAAFINEQVLPAFQGLGTYLPSFESILSFINEHWAIFDAVIKSFGATIAGLGLAAIFTGIGGAILGLLNPITLLIGAMTALGTIWVLYGDQIRGKASEIFQYLSTIFPALQDPILTLQNLWTQFMQAGSASLGIWQSIANTFMSLFWPALQAGSDLIVSIIDLVTQLGLLLYELAGAIGEVAGAWLAAGLRKVASWLGLIDEKSEAVKGTTELLNHMVEQAKMTWDLYKEALKGVTEITKWLAEKIGGLAGKISDLRDWLKKLDLGKFEPGSPSPFEVSVRGVVDAFRELRLLTRSLALQPAVAQPVPAGPTYNVNVWISGGTPESAREAAYEAVLEAFRELEAQLGV